MTGFITMQREAREHHLLKGDSARLGAWFWIVAEACWKPTKFDIKGKTITLERGQFCTSRARLAEAWGWSPSAVERFLTRLETEQMIERATGQGRTIITICNYEKYQDISERPGQATGQATGQTSDSHRTAKEQGNQITIEEPDGSSDARADERQQVIDHWNAMALPAGLQERASSLTEKRKRQMNPRLREHGIDAICQAIDRIPTSSFLTGRNDRGWRADIDFLLRPDSVTKILEGKYDDRPNHQSAGQGTGDLYSSVLQG